MHSILQCILKVARAAISWNTMAETIKLNLYMVLPVGVDFFTHFIGEHFIIQIIQIKNKLFARRINQTQLAKERIENML